MIFLILLQIQVDSLYSEEKFFLFRGTEPPKEVIEIFDSIFYSVLNSIDSSNKEEDLGLFFLRFRAELGKNKKLIDYAEQFYIENGQWLPYYVPRLPLSNMSKSIEILREWKRKHNRYLYDQRLLKVEDSLFKKRLEEYYKYKDDLYIWYEEIPKDMAVDEDFVYLGVSLYMGGIFWFNKVGDKWFVNKLYKLNPDDSLFVGYFSLLQSQIDTTASLFLLSLDSLREMSRDSFYYVYHNSLEEETWVIEFNYNREKKLWDVNPVFLPLYFDEICLPSLNHPIYNINKNSKLFSFLSKSLSKIEEISNINSGCRVDYYGSDGQFVWWISDRFSGYTYERVKVKFFFFKNIIHSDIHQLSCSTEEIFPKAFRLLDKKIEDNIGKDRFIDSVTVYYRLPWADKPEIKLVDNGIIFLVKPTRNPIYKAIHTIFVTGLTFKNIGLKIGRFFRHIFLSYSISSSYIWTFVVVSAICFLIGFGIFKLKVFISRRNL